MSNRKIIVPIKSTEDYLTLFDFIYNFTDVEKEILARFIHYQQKINESSTDINAFSTPIKKRVAEDLNREDFSTLNTYIKRLKDKRAIDQVNNGYVIHPYLIPKGVNTLTIEMQWQKKEK